MHCCAAHIERTPNTEHTHTHCITLLHSSLARDSQSQAPDSALDAKHEILWFDVPVDNALTLQATGMARLQPGFFSDPIDTVQISTCSTQTTYQIARTSQENRRAALE